MLGKVKKGPHDYCCSTCQNRFTKPFLISQEEYDKHHFGDEETGEDNDEGILLDCPVCNIRNIKWNSKQQVFACDNCGYTA